MRRDGLQFRSKYVGVKFSFHVIWLFVRLVFFSVCIMYTYVFLSMTELTKQVLDSELSRDTGSDLTLPVQTSADLWLHPCTTHSPALPAGLS